VVSFEHLSSQKKDHAIDPKHVQHYNVAKPVPGCDILFLNNIWRREDKKEVSDKLLKSNNIILSKSIGFAISQI